MSLTNCPKCNHSVSTSADNCPKCRMDIKSHLEKQRKLEWELKQEKERQNAKCPDCKNSLSWGSTKEKYGVGAGHMVYGSYCTNCGYKSSEYRKVEKLERDWESDRSWYSNTEY